MTPAQLASLTPEERAIEHAKEFGHEVVSIAHGNVLVCEECPFVEYAGL